MFARIAALGFLAVIFLGWSAGYWSARAAQDSRLEISIPVSGDVLQGVVNILGTTDVPGFQSAEISFGYQGDPTGTWFLIEQSSRPVEDDLLAAWDTSTITDGEYRIRVVVFLSGGQVLEAVVENLRVRNYSPVETNTPDPRERNQSTPTATQTSRPDYQARLTSPTPLPTNPAELTPTDLSASALRGTLVVVGALATASLYLGVRSLLRHR